MSKNITDEQLAEQSLQLTKLTTHIRLVERLLENVSHSISKKDEFSIQYYASFGLFDDLIDSLVEIREKTQQAADAIHPEE